MSSPDNASCVRELHGSQEGKRKNKKKDKQQKEGRGIVVSLEKLFVKIFLKRDG